MGQITIKIEDDLLEKIKNRMEKNGCKTLSECARELFDLALRVEEAASSQEGNIDETIISPALIDVLKSNLIWLLETRFLVRVLVENKKDFENQNSSDLFKIAKEKALEHVVDLMKKVQKV